MATQVLTEFIKALRGADINVSTAESLDAVQVAEKIGYADRARLRTALSLALAKSVPDKMRFEKCFDDFFRFTDAPQVSPPASGTAAAMPPQQEDVSSGQGAGAAGGAGGSGDGESAAAGSELGQLLERGDNAEIAQRMAAAARQVDLTRITVITQKGLFARRMMMAMGLEALDQEIFQLTAARDPRALSLRAARNALREASIEEVNRQFLLHARETRQQLREEVMREVSLRDLAEFRDVRLLVEKMARRLVSLHGRQKRRARRGVLDARRTLVASVRHDALPTELHWKARRPRKPKLFVICDVSSSVAAASRFLLLFLSAVNEVLPRVRSFAFASRTGEVTDYFNEAGPSGVEAAVDRVLSEYAGSGTDYGEMLAYFWRQCESNLDRQSTVIILGDARNNDLPAAQQDLARIAERSRQVLWLNPEGRNRWGSGDSVMPMYLPYCRRAMPCRNLNQLERFVEALLRDMK
ncbi:VWA domain-containing protein [Alcanivorax sp. JB21]|uniref:VWA domain-containing protein n=1 Tax=Alcanivorax limicola TaxID=2874102 RepID=UPI001CBD4039|nr:VWA domain-containing protein [Alcanivorax limicola]MBZ2190496.1 VWA domain-containing protein [Alcanivorax limicola]